MFGWLKALVLDKRARAALAAGRRARAAPPAKRPAATQERTHQERTPQERTPAIALAEAEARMKVLPPEKAQLVRTAMLVHKATREAALAELGDEERAKLEKLARRTFLGGE